MKPALRGPLVLPEDVVLAPISQMPEEWRQRLGGEEGDYAISRPHSREASVVVDANGAALLEHFRSARTIVRAVLKLSRERSLDPEETLESALPLLSQLLANGLLVPEGSDSAERIVATLDIGATFSRYTVLRCVQVLADSELYQARTSDGGMVALKLARRGREEFVGSRLVREAAALRRLDGVVSPALVETGEASGRPFLAQAWRSGIDPETVASQMREANDREALLGLLTAIARAYSALHDQGVVHGDVHIGNVLVDRRSAVTLLDYGLAEFEADGLDRPARGGVSFFFEPEWAEAMLAGQTPPRATTSGEQFGVAALLYLLATGHYYAEFSLESETLLRQIAEAPPLPFKDRSVQPWPELEAVLGRALAKQPDLRYRAVSTLAEALAAIAPPSATQAPVRDRGVGPIAETLIEYLRPGSDLFRTGLPAGPVCSANLGAAGIAYALYRLACLQDDSELLADAELWITRAIRDLDREDAFASPELDFSEEITGCVSLYHSAVGVYLVRALIGLAAGHTDDVKVALDRFVTASRQPCTHRDLALGRCGTVLGCALLLEAGIEGAEAAVEGLLSLGRERLAEIWDEVDTFGPLLECADWPNLGMAHGWAGLLYVSLRWHAITGDAHAPRLGERLAQLRECSWPVGRGLMIPWRERVEDQHGMSGWCNGAAGLVELGCEASKVLGDTAQEELAEGMAWAAWEGEDRLADLCCGLAGRAYSLLAFHRFSGEAVWLERARTLADMAARLAPSQRGPEHPRHSLYKGELGVELMLAELKYPRSASMPLFGVEV